MTDCSDSVDTLRGMDNSRGSSKREEYTNEVDDSQLEHVKEIEAMAENETKTVGFWKFFVVATIVTTAAMVASGTYIFLNNENESNFEQSVSTTLDKPTNTSLTINAPFDWNACLLHMH